MTLLIPALLAALTSSAFAKVDVKVTSLTNISGNGAMEACGLAVDSEGAKPLLVTIKHDQSYYSTLTDFSGHWCALVKRWTFDGNIDVSAVGLQKQNILETKILSPSSSGVSATGSGSGTSETSACYSAKDRARYGLESECRSKANGKSYHLSGVSSGSCDCQESNSASSWSCEVRSFASCEVGS